MPFVNNRIVLHTWVSTLPSCVCHHVHELTRLPSFDRSSRNHRVCGPIAIGLNGFHKLVGHTYRVVGILKRNRSIRSPIHGSVIPCVHERPCFLFFIHLAHDEIVNVWVVDIQNNHLCRTTCFSSTLDHTSNRIQSLHKRNRSGS